MPTGSEAGSVDGGSAIDSGPQPDSGGGADAGPVTSGTALAGEVFVVDNVTGGGESGGVTVRFQRTNSTACSARTVGTCSVLRCDLGDAGAPSVVNLSAGNVSITGGTQPFVVMPASDNSYSPVGIDSIAVGATVAVSATGGDLPAFSTSVVFPSPVVVTAPSGKPVIDHTMPFALAWTGGGANRVVAVLSESVPDRYVEVTCLFDAATGSGTIPVTALSDFEAATMLGSGGGEADVSIYSVGAAPLTPGGFPVLVAAGSTAFSALPDVH